MSIEFSKPGAAPPGMRGALFVDLDGTLIDCDLLRRALAAVVLRPQLWFRCGFWFIGGRALLKDRLSQIINHEVARLPYRPEVLRLIDQRKGLGERVVLASATAQRWASAVATHLGCFDDVLASSERRNLKGREKRAAIMAYCQTHGIERFGYVGDSHADLPIWEIADDVYVAANHIGVKAQVEKLHRPFTSLTSQAAKAANATA